MTAASPVEPCGGCGNADPAKVCIGCLHFATPPASPAEPTERERLYEIAKAGGNWYAAAKPIPDEAFDALATPPASPAATDEEVARMVERLLHDCSRIGEPHDHMIMAQAADLLARVAREQDEARDWLRLRAHDIVELGQQLAAAEQRAEAAEKVLAIANRGGLDLLYAVRKAIGWTDKHALSLLPDECARLKKAAVRNAPIWPGKDFDHSQPGGFDGPTGAD